jgi:transcription antitermination factor NusG
VDGTIQDPWYVLHVLSNHEKRVSRFLSLLNIEHYLPQYSERSRWSDRTVTLERPLFVGYVFARFQAGGRCPVIGTPGVLKILGRDRLDMVADEEIDRIRRALTAGCKLRPHPQVTAGSRVRVVQGIFAGAEGVVTELRKHCSVIIELPAVQQFFSLEVNMSDIEVLAKNPTTENSHASGMFYPGRERWANS